MTALFRKMSFFESIYVFLVSIGAVYVVVIAALLHPTAQRFAVYANNFHTAWWDNLNEPEQWGFAKNQIQPFVLTTPDNATLYCWSLLPLQTWIENSAVLTSQDPPQKNPIQASEFTESVAYKLLSGDPEARVVISFHGNAGHLAQHHRSRTLQLLTRCPHTYIFTLDYRSFGLSHPSPLPTEEGILTDGLTFLNFIIQDLNVSPGRIVILGQSLGTAIAAGVADLYYNANTSDPSLADSRSGVEDQRYRDEENPQQAPLLAEQSVTSLSTAPLKGIILVAPFATLPTLLPDYSIGHIFPLLSPLRVLPGVRKSMLGKWIVDKWDTSSRIQRVVRTALHRAAQDETGTEKSLDLQIIHALDDWDIPYKNSFNLYNSATLVASSIEGRDNFTEIGTTHGERVEEWSSENGNVNIRLQIVKYGAHNDVMNHAVVSLALLRSFGEDA